jgi:hypothetical protein
VALGRHHSRSLQASRQQTVSAKVERDLRRLGTVKRISGGSDATANSIAFARFVDGSFGWGVVDPGHGLVFVNQSRPLDAAAGRAAVGQRPVRPAARASGRREAARALESYLLDIQPGYRKDPVRGVYNHGWIIGDEAALPIVTQSRIDALLKIIPVDTDRNPQPSS